MRKKVEAQVEVEIEIHEDENIAPAQAAPFKSEEMGPLKSTISAGRSRFRSPERKPRFRDREDHY